MEPIITPFTKYFCTKGYMASMGSVASTMMEYLSEFLSASILAAISGS